MAVITFPDTLRVARMHMELRQQGVANEGPFGMQFNKTGSPRWAATVELATETEDESGAAKAIWMKLRGPTNQLALHDLARPVPRGTMRGNLTFFSGNLAGDTAVSFTGGASQALKTLRAGDLIGFGSGLTQQVVMVMEDATADAAGAIAINIEPPLRHTFVAGAPAVWDRPKVLYRSQVQVYGWDYENKLVSGLTLQLIEDVRP